MADDQEGPTRDWELRTGATFTSVSAQSLRCCTVDGEEFERIAEESSLCLIYDDIHASESENVQIWIMFLLICGDKLAFLFFHFPFSCDDPCLWETIFALSCLEGKAMQLCVFVSVCCKMNDVWQVSRCSEISMLFVSAVVQSVCVSKLLFRVTLKIKFDIIF